MSLKLGGSKSKTTTTSNNTSHSTTTPQTPDWANSLVPSVASRVGGLTGLDPQGFVAPANDLQATAAASAAKLGQGGSDALDSYLDSATPFASGGKAYDFVDRYLNPYLSAVVDSSAADFDANAGRVRAQQALNLAGSGAFGGSGAALTQSLTEGELARARASTLSGLRSQGYQQALTAASGDADRATQARIANAQLSLQDSKQKADLGFQRGLQLEANQRANIATQAELGSTLRGISQEQAQAPLSSTQQLVAMLSGLPIGLFTGQSTDQTESGSGTSKTKGSNWEFGVTPDDLLKFKK